MTTRNGTTKRRPRRPEAIQPVAVEPAGDDVEDHLRKVCKTAALLVEQIDAASSFFESLASRELGTRFVPLLAIAQQNLGLNATNLRAWADSGGEVGVAWEDAHGNTHKDTVGCLTEGLASITISGNVYVCSQADADLLQPLADAEGCVHEFFWFVTCL